MVCHAASQLQNYLTGSARTCQNSPLPFQEEKTPLLHTTKVTRAVQTSSQGMCVLCASPGIYCIKTLPENISEDERRSKANRTAGA